MALKKPNIKIAKPQAAQSFARKESIIKKLNERMASIVRNAGTQNEDYIRWAGKLTRPGSPYAASTNVYDPDKIKLKRNKGANKERTEYVALSRKKSDIEAMSLEDLQRLEEQTRGWGTVKREAKKALEDQREEEKKRERLYVDENPFEAGLDEEAAEPQPEPEPITDEEISKYLKQKEAVRQFIEGHDEAFYALIEATGWDDIRQHTTEEIYREAQKIDINTYEFQAPLSEIGEAYIKRREASREHRRALGIL